MASKRLRDVTRLNRRTHRRIYDILMSKDPCEIPEWHGKPPPPEFPPVCPLFSTFFSPKKKKNCATSLNFASNFSFRQLRVNPVKRIRFSLHLSLRYRAKTRRNEMVSSRENAKYSAWACTAISTRPFVPRIETRYVRMYVDARTLFNERGNAL